jgi:hypothetical protein
MNTGSALAPIPLPLVFGVIVERTGSWTLPFVGTMGLMLGVLAAFAMRPDQGFGVMPQAGARVAEQVRTA